MRGSRTVLREAGGEIPPAYSPGDSTNMARRFGWAPQGERCRISVPFGHWKTKTLIAALRFDRIDAPMTIDGALDGARSWPMSNRSWRRRFLRAKPW